MRNILLKSVQFLFLSGVFLMFGSWTGGPHPECKSDSLAIVRVVKPMNDMFNIKPVVYVSKGRCKIDEVKVSDTEHVDGDVAVRATLTELLTRGFVVQSSTETFDSGLKLNTYYLKKKAI